MIRKTDAPTAAGDLVLVVEDNPVALKLMRIALTTSGFRVIEAPDGHSALAAAIRQVPDLVLQDLHLPDVDGFELVARLHALPGCERVPVVAVSGFLSKMDPARMLGVGFTDCVLKPVEPSRLVDVVRSHLRRPPQSSRKAAGGGRTVLVVDDDAVQRKLVALAFEQAGFRVVAVEDGSEAFDAARDEPPDAVVSDVLMPRVDGFRLCMKLREDPALANVPIVLVTSAYVEDEDRAMALACGADALCVRTSDLHDLVDKVTTTLRSPRGDPAGSPRPAVARDRYVQRVVHQLEQQVTLNSTLSRRLALAEAEVAILAGLADTLKAAGTPESVLGDILYRTVDAAGVQCGAVFLPAADGSLRLVTQCGFAAQRLAGLESFFGRMDLLQHVLSEAAPLAVPFPGGPHVEFRRLLDEAGAKSVLLAPLVAGRESVGVLVIGAAHREIGEDWRSFANAIGSHVGHAIGLSRGVLRLADSERRFRDLVDGLDAVVWEADAKTLHFTFVSRHAKEMLGCEPARFLGKDDFWEVVHGEDGASARQLLLDAVASGKDAVEIELSARTASGEHLSVRHTVSILRDEHGPSQLRGVMLDVTARQEKLALEDQLRQAQKLEAIGRLAGGVAHDFNNLLTVITGYSEFARAEAAPDSALRRSLDEIHGAAERAAGLTQRLLAFSRKQILAPTIIDLNEVVTSIAPMISRLVGEDVELTLSLQPSLGSVRADRGQIEQVLMNLAVNARDAMPGGGRLTIETADVVLDSAYARSRPDVQEGPHVMLVVTDTGHGMDRAVMERMFEPFFTTKQAGKGTGLGLATVHGIVRQSGGHVVVSSERGVGTTFRIHLPRVGEGPESAVPPAHAKDAGGEGTILVVEDEAALRGLALRILTGAGYAALTATDGEDALAVCERHAGPIDLVVTDVVMPRMSGPEFVERFARLRPGVPVIFMSGYPDKAMTKNLLQSPDTVLLPKPFTPEELRRKVREVLDKARAG